MTRSASSRARRPAAPSTTGVSAAPHRLQKGAQLAFQRLRVAGPASCWKSNFGCGPGLRHANAQRVLPRVVHRNVLVLLEEAQLAHAFDGDAAGGDVGHRAGGEFQARVRDVHLVGDDGNAQRVNLRDRRIHQASRMIQVVNHHVVHHVNIQAARREHAEAMQLRNTAAG